MSLGIITFACMTMLGLIPAGLNSFHQAMNNMTESQIVQGLTEDMSLANYSNVSSQGSGNTTSFLKQAFYYDAEGVPTNASGYVYKATVTSTDLNNSPVLGSSGGGSSLTANYGSTVVIQIASINQPGVTNYFPGVIANQGY